ncbi:MAG: GDSL-type esterase/lipase family protein [Solirubrobacteraceae bacterium]
MFSGLDGCRLGVLAFGDSITNGGGELQWGVALQSWALWAARGLGLPFSGYAVDGAACADVVAQQIPAFEQQAARPQARYELGCLYVGTNDVRGPGWDVGAFASSFDVALGFLAAHCDRVLTVTLPLDLGRPRAPAKITECNREIEAAAGRHRALVLDLRAFAARNLVMADHVHPTAFGQIAIAERALDVLARDGMHVAARPRTMISYETTLWGQLRGDLTYLYRHAKVSAKALRAQGLTTLKARP